MKTVFGLTLLSGALLFSGCVGYPSCNNITLSHNINISQINAIGANGFCSRDRRNWNLLNEAVRKGNAPLVSHLVANGARLNPPFPASQNWTPLSVAIAVKNLSMVKLLLNLGADINYKDAYGNYLHDAVRANAYDIVSYLLSKGLDPLEQNSYKQTALELAESANLKALLENGQENSPIYQNQQEALVQGFLEKKDLEGLKRYSEENPQAVYYIQNKELRLLLTGPKGMKVGDVKKLIDAKRNKTLIISLIKRVKSPYKEYSLEEIDTLVKMGISEEYVAAMIDITTMLLRDKKLQEQQAFLLKEQQRIQNTTEPSQQKSNILTNTLQQELIKQGAKKLFEQLF